MGTLFCVARRCRKRRSASCFFSFPATHLYRALRHLSLKNAPDKRRREMNSACTTRAPLMNRRRLAKKESSSTLLLGVGNRSSSHWAQEWSSKDGTKAFSTCVSAKSALSSFHPSSDMVSKEQVMTFLLVLH